MGGWALNRSEGGWFERDGAHEVCGGFLELGDHLAADDDLLDRLGGGPAAAGGRDDGPKADSGARTKTNKQKTVIAQNNEGAFSCWICDALQNENRDAFFLLGNSISL